MTSHGWVTVPGVMRTATLGLVNATNARDLGGFATADGRSVRRGLLFRANALNRLTDEDVLALGRLGLAHVIDFRHAEEIELTGPDRLPAAPACRLVSLPLFDPDHDVFTTVSAALRGVKGARSELLLRLSPQRGGAAAAMVELYRWFVASPVARETVATVVRMLASTESLPLLFHCTAGKDRTGWLSAVLLHALGVDRDAVVSDYLRTNDLNASGTAHLLATVAGRLEDPSVLLPLLEARAEYIEAAFDEVDAAYGGMDGYLRDGLEIDATTLAALRHSLLE